MSSISKSPLLRVVLIVGLMLQPLALLASAQATSVTSNDQVPINILVFVPCVPELVAIEGTLHILSHVTFDANGGFHLEQHFQPQGVSGTGLLSGAKYQGTGVTRFDINTSGPPPFEATSVNNFRIIGQGSGNNLLVHFNTHTTVNANGVVTATVSNIRIDCK